MIRIAIIGLGRVFFCYEEFFKKNKSKKYLVKVVCDSDEAKALQASESLSCEMSTNLEEVLNREDIDLVIVLTESGNHYTHSKKVLKSKKHLIVEKPVCFFPEEVLELQEIAVSNDLQYSVIHQNRFNPSIVALKKAMDSCRFKKLILSSISLKWSRFQEYYEDGWHGKWSMDGGVVSQQAIHHIDALQWICGPIKKLVSKQNNAVNNLEAEDTSIVLLEFLDGSLGTIEATTASRVGDIEASISILGEGGHAEIGGIALNKIIKWNFSNKNDEDKNIFEEASEEVSSGYGNSHPRILNEILNNLYNGNINTPVSGIDALESIKIVQAIYSSEENKTWVDLSNNPISSNLGNKNGRK